MDIYFDKGTSKEEVILEKDILEMTKQEIKNLKQRCQNTMNDIATKRNMFRTENELAQNSKEFWRKMYVYKLTIAKFTKAIAWLSQIECNARPPKQQVESEHWLWCYYQESLKMLTEEMVNQIVEMTDARAKFHLEIEKWEFKGETK